MWYGVESVGPGPSGGGRLGTTSLARLQRLTQAFALVSSFYLTV
jgi:hypothetical protein